MTPQRRFVALLALLVLEAGGMLTVAFGQQASPQIDPSLYSGMRWRLIGPHRGGRVTTVAGIAGQPGIYYMGTPGGGVWKTTDGGDVWKPIFDQERVASIGALAIAPSNPNILYVGTGEQTPGNGVYKSIDGGTNWTGVGLRETMYITSLIVDPHNPNLVIAGALGAPTFGGGSAPSTERGVFRSTDGGKTWTKTLYRDNLSGVSDMCSDPSNPHVLYSALWNPRNAAAMEGPSKEPDGWIYKSTDGGATWKQLPDTGLPSGPLGRVGLTVAPGNSGKRIFAIMAAGLFRSDDGGESWHKITKDPRVTGNSYICHVYVDPGDADTVYVMQTSIYRSADGGKTFVAFKGAPGGDDYHVMWIDPQNPRRMILGVDQGATTSVDGGKTWSSWYNQPTGQFYHVITDHQFPYIAYAAQQDSGTAAVPSQSDYGEITYRDWFSIGGFEFCFIAPDPLNPNIVYSGGWYGSVVRFDKTTGQIAHVFVRGRKYRTVQMAPLIFSPQDSGKLYLGTQYVLVTTNGGDNWQTISPDLTERPAAIEGQAADEKNHPATGPAEKRPNRGAITSLAPSPLQAGVIWAGTSNGLIQLTQDGGASWQNVSPPELPDKNMVITIEASHFDAKSAYTTVQVRQDSSAYVYRTRDSGKTWQKIIEGLARDWVVRVVREDPVRQGMLYAGTQNGAYVSFDHGDHWQSLQLNLPTTDVRDLAIHQNDVVAATYGRALWILDDVSPLRQASAQMASSNAVLLRPASAIRTRWDNDQETPLPPEVPAGENPPDGAILDYFLNSRPAGELTLEIHDSQGNMVRQFTSVPPPPDTAIKNVPDYWFRPASVLTKNAGLNRFVWDLRYQAPAALPYGYFGELLDYVEYALTNNAIAGETPSEQPQGALVVPGQYEVVLIAGGQRMRQTFSVTLDPRIHVPPDALARQLSAAKRVSAGLKSSNDGYHSAAALRSALAERQKSLAALAKDNPQTKEASEATKDLDSKIDAVENGTPEAPGFGPVNRELARILFMVESGDAAPSETAQDAIAESCRSLSKDFAQWRELNTQVLPPLNELLERNKLAPLRTVTTNSATSTPDPCHE
ncbi:MAG TPA: hypothetical protein VOA41_03540 [Candidatus Dormibacteraeota bacterium]|nr:hypothetical protein [Candidatus Dormibacteraeota bacterium]